jgi:hypothetical protein
VRRLACAVAAGLLFGAVSAAAADAVHVTRFTKSFRLSLSVGPKETMYSAGEVETKHPASGEVIVGDGMSMGGMSMGAGNRHLEVQIRSRATRKPLGVEPVVTLTDTTAMNGMATAGKLHVMAMYGIAEGRADLHYGNNVALTAGHSYEVVVAIKGEKATFTFQA